MLKQIQTQVARVQVHCCWRWPQRVLLAGLFLACSPIFAAPSVVAPAWPSPPAEPYIVYVRDIAGPKDIGARPSFFSRLGNAITGTGSQQNNFSRPFGLSLDAADNLVVTDTGANAVCYLDPAHKKWSRWSVVGGERLQSPVAAVHLGQTFFVADSALGKVIGFDASGKVSVTITNEMERPTGLALLGEKLVIADSQRHQIVICDVTGKFISKFGQRGKEPGEFNFPTHVAVDDQRQIYVTDSLNHRIQVFDAAGKFLRAFGSAGDGPGHFSRPKGVAVDTSGHVYVVDAVFNNVQIFDGQGRLLLDFGETGSEVGKFYLPNALAINSKNEIFVTDAYNHRVQMFRYTGRQ